MMRVRGGSVREVVVAQGERGRRAGPLVQGLCLAYVALALATAAAGLTIHYRNPRLVGSPLYLDFLAGLGVPIALATTLSFVVPIAAAAALAAAVFVGRRDDPNALLFAVALLGLFVFYSASPRAVALTYPALAPAALLVEAVGLAAVVLVVYTFPDGRFRPAWTRPVAGAIVTLLVLVPDLPATARLLIVMPDTLAAWKVALAVGTLAVLLGTGALAQALRYRRHATIVERQQQRWILFGLATVLVPAIVALAVAALGAGRVMVGVVFAMSLLGSVLPATAAVALFRYRLFELDRVVSRTLSWTALTLLLAAAYGVLVIALQALLAPLAGGSDLAVALSTLAVAVLFSTARRRVQAIVDRSFNRARYDTQQVVEEFGQALRRGLPRDELVTRLAGVVHETLQPASVTVWLQGDDSSSGELARAAPRPADDG